MANYLHPSRKILLLFYMALFLFAIAFYIIWGAMYNGWFDVGVYSFTVVFFFFGLFGLLLYSRKGHIR